MSTTTISAVGQTASEVISGVATSHAIVDVSGVFTVSSLTFEVSEDGGVNWISSAYGKRIDQAVALNNVTVASTTVLAPASWSRWEIPLSSMTTHVRARCTALSTGSMVVQVLAGRPYIPGVPVSATLYDVLSAVNTPLDTGIMETAGWSFMRIEYLASGGTASVGVGNVRATGTGTVWGGTQTGNFTTFRGRQGASAVAVPALGNRMQIQAAAIAGQTNEIRVEVSR